MNSQKAAYWIALAIMAAALHSEYQRGAFPVLHRAVYRAEASFCPLVSRAERAYAMARMLALAPAADPVPSPFAEGPGIPATIVLSRSDLRELRNLARLQAQMARERVLEQVRAQAELYRSQASLTRQQVDQIRVRTLSHVQINRAKHRVTVMDGDCPGMSASVTVDSPDSNEDGLDNN